MQQEEACNEKKLATRKIQGNIGTRPTRRRQARSTNIPFQEELTRRSQSRRANQTQTVKKGHPCASSGSIWSGSRSGIESDERCKSKATKRSKARQQGSKGQLQAAKTASKACTGTLQHDASLHWHTDQPAPAFHHIRRGLCAICHSIYRFRNTPGAADSMLTTLTPIKTRENWLIKSHLNVHQTSFNPGGVGQLTADNPPPLIQF